MTVTYSKFQAGDGFTSPSLDIDSLGNISANSISVSSISVGGAIIFGTGAPGAVEGEPVTSLTDSIVSSSLTSLGTLTGLTVAGNTTISDGLVQITSSSTGTINNVNIGAATPG